MAGSMASTPTYAAILKFDFSNPTASHIKPDWNSRMTTVIVDDVEYTLSLNKENGELLPPGANTWGGNCLQWGNNSDFAAHGEFSLTISPVFSDVSEIEFVAAQTVNGASGWVSAGVITDNGIFEAFTCAGAETASLSTVSNEFNTYLFASETSYDGTVVIKGCVDGAFSVRSIKIKHNEEVQPDPNRLQFDFSTNHGQVVSEDKIMFDYDGTIYDFVVEGRLCTKSEGVEIRRVGDNNLSLTLAEKLSDVSEIVISTSAPQGRYKIMLVDNDLESIFTLNGNDNPKLPSARDTKTLALNHSASGRLRIEFIDTDVASIYYISFRHSVVKTPPEAIELDYRNFTPTSDGAFITEANGFTYGLRDLLHESPFMWWCDTENWQGVQFGATSDHIDEFSLRLSPSLCNAKAVLLEVLAKDEAAVRVYSMRNDNGVENVLECRSSQIVNIPSEYATYKFVSQEPFDGRLYISGLGQSFVRIRSITILNDESASNIDTIISDCNNDADSTEYDMLGRPVGKDYKGFVISRGKKYIKR